ncbi:CstA-like transporter-associated (seleno)protein [Streptomyces sp. NPDC094448]|uniref:CstA-like transporter-associated (seleno)protein n=1 Tax=Streptomyces sp. NPDC094448 TaxID=3366063 RepID=UPI00381D4764
MTAAAVGNRLRAVYRYLREVSGDTAYDRYCEHRLRARPGEPVPTRREFQRQRARKLEESPQSRCC